MSLVHDPLALFWKYEIHVPEWSQELHQGYVKFDNWDCVTSCVAAIQSNMPLTIGVTPVDMLLGRAFPSYATLVSIRYQLTRHTPIRCAGIMWEICVQASNSVEFSSEWIDRDLTQRSLHDKVPKHNPSLLFNLDKPLFVRNCFNSVYPCTMLFSDLAAAARKKRRDKLAALLVGTRAKNAPCAVKRFVQHQLSERQLFLVIKTFL